MVVSTEWYKYRSAVLYWVFASIERSVETAVRDWGKIAQFLLMHVDMQWYQKKLRHTFKVKDFIGASWYIQHLLKKGYFYVKNNIWGAGEMASISRALAVLPENLSLFPSTHIRQLDCSCSSSEGLPGTYTRVYLPTRRYTPTSFKY